MGSRKKYPKEHPLATMEPMDRMQRWYICQSLGQLIFRSTKTNAQLKAEYNKQIKQFNINNK